MKPKVNVQKCACQMNVQLHEDNLKKTLPKRGHFQRTPPGICCKCPHKDLVFPHPQMQPPMSSDFRYSSPLPYPEPKIPNTSPNLEQIKPK